MKTTKKSWYRLYTSQKLYDPGVLGPLPLMTIDQETSNQIWYSNSHGGLNSSLLLKSQFVNYRPVCRTSATVCTGWQILTRYIKPSADNMDRCVGKGGRRGKGWFIVWRCCRLTLCKMSVYMLSEVWWWYSLHIVRRATLMPICTELGYELSWKRRWTEINLHLVDFKPVHV